MGLSCWERNDPMRDNEYELRMKESDQCTFPEITQRSMGGPSPGFRVGLVNIEGKTGNPDEVPTIHFDILVIPEDWGKPNASVRAVAAAIYGLGQVVGDAAKFAEEAWRFLQDQAAQEKDGEAE